MAEQWVIELGAGHGRFHMRWHCVITLHMCWCFPGHLGWHFESKSIGILCRLRSVEMIQARFANAFLGHKSIWVLVSYGNLVTVHGYLAISYLMPKSKFRDSQHFYVQKTAGRNHIRWLFCYWKFEIPDYLLPIFTNMCLGRKKGKLKNKNTNSI
jgi:hypothetical protein